MLQKGQSLVSKVWQQLDWVLFFSILPILGAGLVTMNAFVGNNYFFDKQLVSIGITLAIFFVLSLVDFRFLRRTSVIVALFLISFVVLVTLFMLGHTANGAQSWFKFGAFAFEPGDPIKLVVILLLAKYFSRRHIEIANIRHIFVSGFYALVIFLLVFLQPDFGSAIIIFCIWFGMVFASGISRKHIMAVLLIGIVLFGGAWMYVLKPYQKDRIANFVHPLANIRGSGYNAYQSTIAVGSGQTIGKGVGYGTQSRLNFLPEYQTDFIFAAFAEEWGFIGALFIIVCMSVFIWRVLVNAQGGATNFEMLYGIGLAVFFGSHFIINIGMNIGILPVTGITVPFMSYGGTHLMTEFVGLGILMGMRRYRKVAGLSPGTSDIVGVGN
jgi:rod shape determining protein RodA